MESTLPKIRQGVPLRIRSISVAVNKSGFMFNPTNCSAFQTVSTVGSFTTLEPGGATASSIAYSPFQVANCNTLKFTPKFKATSNAKTSRSNGADADDRSHAGRGPGEHQVRQGPAAASLPSRLTTLQKACTEQVFTPTRCAVRAVRSSAAPSCTRRRCRSRCAGPAILVSHAGASFPDLDLVVEDPNHLRVILVGNTNIKNSITTTTFASTPDVPVSSVRVELPIGSHSALGGVREHLRQVAGHADHDDRAERQVVQTEHDHQRGRVPGGDRGTEGRRQPGVGHRPRSRPRVGSAAAARYLHKTSKKAKKAHQKLTLKVPLTSAGRSKKPLTVHVRIGFLPKKGKSSTATTKVTFH